MNVDLGFVYKTPTVTFNNTAFLLPFTLRVWLCILASLVLTSFFLYLFNKVFPNDDPLRKMTECLFFGIACLLGQGPETYPRQISSRIAAISYWFLSLMMILVYAATLTSMLTVNTAKLPFKNIEDLLNYDEYHFGIAPDSIVQRLFEFSDYTPFQKMWERMSKNGERSFHTDEAGIARARSNDKFVFIGESPYLQYNANSAPCNLELVLSPYSPKTGTGLAFAFPIDSPLTELFSIELLDIFSNGRMAAIHAKWYGTSSQCAKKNFFSNTAQTFGFDQVAGVFYTFLCGLLAAFILFIVKFIQQRTKLRRKRV